MYGRPPLFGWSFYTTSVNPNATTFTALLAAPGAGMAYRLSQWSITLQQNMVGSVRVYLWDGVQVLSMLSCTQNQPFAQTTLPFPGLLVPTNRPISVAHISNFANQSFHLLLSYYTDSVS